ncbi:MAG: MBL fold metallo-hydrolase [Candidatus Sumerlaeia bacterium]|nr:MBL fold metallo-hydrolase [Candidatus Sumerlaeia bacterium]
MTTPEPAVLAPGAVLLPECRFRLDGGAMFGHVPKVVWSRMIETDEQNRIALACWPLLLRHPAGRIALVETGMGAKWSAKDAAVYALEQWPLRQSLAAQGVAPEDVTDVVLTHLHLDHAGGNTEPGPGGAPVCAFPNAVFHVQRGEWERARNPDFRSRPSYRAENYDPIPADRWNLIDGEAEPLPGVRVAPSTGHTLWHQSVFVEFTETPIHYLGDLVPSSHHLKPHYVMGYDLYPLEVMANRAKFLAAAAEANAVCVFEHDAHTPHGRIQADGKGGFRLRA